MTKKGTATCDAEVAERVHAWGRWWAGAGAQDLGLLSLSEGLSRTLRVLHRAENVIFVIARVVVIATDFPNIASHVIETVIVRWIGFSWS